MLHKGELRKLQRLTFNFLEPVFHDLALSVQDVSVTKWVPESTASSKNSNNVATCFHVPVAPARHSQPASVMLAPLGSITTAVLHSLDREKEASTDAFTQHDGRSGTAAFGALLLLWTSGSLIFYACQPHAALHTSWRRLHWMIWKSPAVASSAVLSVSFQRNVHSLGRPGHTWKVWELRSKLFIMHIHFIYWIH